MAVGAKKIVKKKWVTIVAPPLFGNQVIGETFVEEPQQAVGRHLVVHLSSLIAESGRQSVQVHLRISGVDQDKLITETLGFNIPPSGAKKLVRRGRSKLDDSFCVKTMDDKTVRVKPLLLTKTKATGKKRALLLKTARSFVTKEVAKKNYTDFLKNVADREFQKSLQEHLKKICPVSAAEIRMLYLEAAA